MEGLGVAANVIAVVDLSTKVATLCFQYSKEVASARADIERLRTQVEHLGTVVQAAQRLVEGPGGSSLSTSQKLADMFQNCSVDLNRLKAKLEPNPKRSTMRRFGLRALKWPFSSKEVEQILSSLKRHEDTIHLGLQIDQTSAIVNIQEGVKQLALQATEDAAMSHMAHRMMPFPPDPDFVHRPPIEKWMHDQYYRPDQRMALVGMGGFGKSQLAIQFAHHFHTDKPETSVFWVQGSSRGTFEESYRALADVLALPRRHDKDADVLALVRNHLQKNDVNPWLMVLDNADDAGVFFDNDKHNTSKHLLASYLPKSIKGKILVTSRSLDLAGRLVGHSRAILRLSVMEELQALELLKKKLEGETDEIAAIELVGALGCIPLAVNQAAAYINRRSPRLNVTSYLEKFRKGEEQKDSLLRVDKGDLGRYEGVSNSVVVTWQVTFEQIKRERPSAAHLLSLMSQFQAQGIPESMLHGYHDDVLAKEAKDAEGMDAEMKNDEASNSDDFENDMDTLRGYSLVAFPSAGLCDMHPLVQVCTRSWIAEFGDPIRWSRLFVKLAAAHFPSGKFETWSTCQSLLPHVEPILRSEANDKGDVLDLAELLTNVGWYMDRLGNYSRAEMLGRMSFEARKEALGVDHPATLLSLSHLAMSVFDQGRWKEAEKLQFEVVESFKAKLGAENPATLASMTNLASTYATQCRWEEAEKLEAAVLRTKNAKFGASHPETLMSKGNLALMISKRGRLDEAEKLMTEAMEGHKSVYGANHPFTLLSINNLASTYRLQHRWEEAEDLHEKVSQALTVTVGAEHPDTLTSNHNLAFTWHFRGRHAEAIALMQDCVDRRRQRLGHNHPDTQSSFEMLQEWQAEMVPGEDSAAST